MSSLAYPVLSARVVSPYPVLHVVCPFPFRGSIHSKRQNLLRIFAGFTTDALAHYYRSDHMWVQGVVQVPVSEDAFSTLGHATLMSSSQNFT